MQVAVREADSASDLASTSAAEEAVSGAETRAVYELTALVAHITGAGEEPGAAQEAPGAGGP